MSFADRQRAALTTLLDELGPFAPTRCEGWNTGALAAHLWVREHRADALPGIGLRRFAGHTDRVQKEALHRWGYPKLVADLRSTSIWRRPVSPLMDGAEYFIHHEDVLRANDRSQELTAEEQASLWKIAKILARKAQLRKPYRLAVTPLGTADRVAFGQSTRTVHVTGLPSELLLHYSGRDADVTVTAEPGVRDDYLANLGGL